MAWRTSGAEDSEGLDTLAGSEAQEGFDKAQAQVDTYLSNRQWWPLPDLLAECPAKLDEKIHIGFITRAGALAPYLYRLSKLMDEMSGRTRVPCVLFLPVTTEGGASLRFMGIAENEERGSYYTKVYTE